MYCIDSRRIEPGDIFIPVKGERFDGHDFIEQALQKGAARVLDVPLASYAEYFRQNCFSAKVIGITGSAGKTTVKDLVTEILKISFSVHKTPQNQNNEIGVPLTILNTPQTAQFLVCEMGMRGRGQILELTRMTRPNYVLIVSLGSTHLELLKTRRNIALAKAEIYQFPKQPGQPYFTFLNEQMPYFELVRKIAEKNGFQVITINESSEIHSNLKLASALAEHLGIASSVSRKVFDRFSTESAHRQRPVPWKENILIDDTYNANPESMRYAIHKLLADYPQHSLAVVLGEMRELGSFSESAHRDLVKFVKEEPRISKAFFYGSAYNKFVKTMGKCYHSASRGGIVHTISEANLHHYAILFKGSRSLQMEDIISMLTHD